MQGRSLAFAVPERNGPIWEAGSAAMVETCLLYTSSPSPFCPVGRKIQSVLDDTYEELKTDVIASMKSITLDKILADYHDKQQKNQ